MIPILFLAFTTFQNVFWNEIDWKMQQVATMMSTVLHVTNFPVNLVISDYNCMHASHFHVADVAQTYNKTVWRLLEEQFCAYLAVFGSATVSINGYVDANDTCFREEFFAVHHFVSDKHAVADFDRACL